MSGKVRYTAIMEPDCIAEFLRKEQAQITKKWEAEVRADLPALRSMSKPVLYDHLAEFLDGLANWIDGKTELAERAFDVLVNGHALQRLGYGVGLETLTREYSKLRMVLMRMTLKLCSSDEARESLVRMHEGMDHAIGAAMTQYARRREEVRERFITILGHDLRDPLSTVMISSNMLAANPGLKPDLRMVASRMTRATYRMQRMINDVLDFARGHLGGGIPANPTLNDMGEIVRAAADEAIGANPQRTITCKVKGDLRGAFDRDRVHQAITNLISNAVHHTDAAIEISAFEGDDRHAIYTEITSHGAPIPDDVRRRLFDPFAHFDGASARRGLGLGLYIVQQIALAHGAMCDVRSDEHGNVFSIRWPRVPGAERRKAANE
jgi:signal transduction histidine kinase